LARTTNSIELQINDQIVGSFGKECQTQIEFQRGRYQTNIDFQSKRWSIGKVAKMEKYLGKEDPWIQ
jgi:hypothetical protein